ncbi:MAG: DUF1579 domain-containing protein [bacterium]|nr:DUF1579 domain-containing protein [bacterium]
MKRFAIAAVLVALVAGGASLGAEEMDPNMKAMIEAGTPGEHHAHLAQAVGSWNYKGKMWMAPGAPPMDAAGTSEVSEMLGGRYFRTDFKGNFMGMPFHGFGMDGYDKVADKHIGVWSDNMSTTMMHFEGECSDGGKTMTMVAPFTDAASGMKLKMKSVTEIVSDSEFKWTAYVLGMGEQPFKTMELVYTRQ